MRDFLVHFGPFYTNGWGQTLASYYAKCVRRDELKDAAKQFLKTLALNGDAEAQRLIVGEFVKDFSDDRRLFIHFLHDYLLNQNFDEAVNNAYKLYDLGYLFYILDDESEEMEEKKFLGESYFINAMYAPGATLEVVEELLDIAIFSIENHDPSFFENDDIDYAEYSILANALIRLYMVDCYDEAFDVFEKYFYNKKDHTIRDTSEYSLHKVSDFIEKDPFEYFSDVYDYYNELLFYLRFFAKRDYDALILVVNKLNKLSNLEEELLNAFDSAKKLGFNEDYPNFKATIIFLEDVKAKNTADKAALDTIVKRFNAVVETYENHKN